MQVIRATKIFLGLPENCLREIAASSKKEVFPKRFLLSQTGESIDRIGIVMSGTAEMRVKDRYGETIRFHLLGDGELFGEMAALENGSSLYDIESLTTMEVLLLSRESFLKLSVHSAMMRNVYQLIAERLQLLCQALISLERRLIPGMAKQEYNVITKAVQFIDENYHEVLTLDKVCQISNLSKFHFVRKFKEIMGLSFKEYLNRKRVTQAKALMKDDNLNISEACYAVGFGDLSYFGRVFRKIEGRSPSEYKKSLKTKP